MEILEFTTLLQNKLWIGKNNKSPEQRNEVECCRHYSLHPHSLHVWWEKQEGTTFYASPWYEVLSHYRCYPHLVPPCYLLGDQHTEIEKLIFIKIITLSSTPLIIQGKIKNHISNRFKKTDKQLLPTYLHDIVFNLREGFH